MNTISSTFEFSKWARDAIGPNGKSVTSKNPKFQIRGNPKRGCSITQGKTLSFVTEKSFVKLPNLTKKTGLRKIEFQFRTLQDDYDGLLFITSGVLTQNAFFGCELYNDKLHWFIQTGNNNKPPLRGEPITGPFNRGQWYTLKFRVDKDAAVISIKNQESPIDVPGYNWGIENLGDFYIGGIDDKKFNTSFIFPYQLRTAVAQRGFTGCIKVSEATLRMYIRVFSVLKMLMIKV